MGDVLGYRMYDKRANACLVYDCLIVMCTQKVYLDGVLASAARVFCYAHQATTCTV